MTKMRKLGRPIGHRISMLRTMVSQLVKHERIETTVAKAKEVRRLADRMITFGKEGNFSFPCIQGKFWDNVNLRESGRADAEHFLDQKTRNKENLNYKGSLCASRRAGAFVRGDDVLHKMFTELAYRYKDRAGGYTRMLRTRLRVRDAAPMAYIELIDRENELRLPKPPTPQPPQRAPLDPWTKSRLSRQYAPPKEDKSLESVS